MKTHITRIRHKLAERNLTIKSVARANGLLPQAIRDAMRLPHRQGEMALSKSLGIPAHELWPERYDEDGQRKNPQPRELYPAGVSVQRLSDEVA